MPKRFNTTLVLSFCLTSGLQAACDAPDDDSVTEREVLEVVAWPPVEASERELAAFDELVAVPRTTASPASPSEELMIGWTQWIMALPWSDGPVRDTTGESCAWGQTGSVWFLAGTSGGSVTRECTIPAGKQLFFPLVNGWATYPVEFYPTEEEREEAIASATGWFQYNLGRTCSLTLRIDGEEVVPGGLDAMVEELWVQVDEPFEIVLNEDNFMSPHVPASTTTATAAGHYARIQPLPPGDHVLELGGRLCGSKKSAFETAATYHLHIGG